ncbi:hypothetical protein SDC9_100912 [bioreactor metagenome]|uniref:Uncharacterized protein n=1 Tax=bioreactor metagenome TaxID=1076179 RepID=A0A645ALW2_9ZZZZ
MGEVNSAIGAVNTEVVLALRISGEIIPITVTVCPGRSKPATPLARSTWIARATCPSGSSAGIPALAISPKTEVTIRSPGARPTARIFPVTSSIFEVASAGLAPIGMVRSSTNWSVRTVPGAMATLATTT